jgi:hypothetical protein
MAKKNRIIVLSFIVLSTWLIWIPSCSDRSKNKPDVSGYELQIHITRLEKALMSVSSLQDYLELDGLDSLFMRQYKSQIMVDIIGTGRVPVEESARAFVDFATNEDMRHLFETTQETFPTMEKQESALSEAFTYFHFYFKDRKIPRVYSYISPFMAATATTDETLAISLDMYLGSNFEPYYSPNLQSKFPQYRINRSRPDYVVPNSVKAWLLKEFEIDNKDRRLLNQMIHEGKILYAMDLLLPDMPDSMKIQYNQGQIEWCEKNEYAIWNNLIENELLYSNEYQKFSGLITEGPFSKGMNVPVEAPPQIALWIGWQIVRKYMHKHPEISLEDLMLNNTPEEILKKSLYKP